MRCYNPMSINLNDIGTSPTISQLDTCSNNPKLGNYIDPICITSTDSKTPYHQVISEVSVDTIRARPRKALSTINIKRWTQSDVVRFHPTNFTETVSRASAALFYSSIFGRDGQKAWQLCLQRKTKYPHCKNGPIHGVIAFRHG